LASSCTRALPGTGLLMGEAGGVARSTSSLVVHGHRGNFTADSSDGVLSTCGPACTGPTLELLCRSRSTGCGHSPVRAPPPRASGEAARTWSRSGPASSGAPPPPGRRSALAKARRRSAACRHSGVGCRDAPRPGSIRRGSGTRVPCRATTRSSSVTGARVRHPTQVRTGIGVTATAQSSARPDRDVPRGAASPTAGVSRPPDPPLRAAARTAAAPVRCPATARPPRRRSARRS
jgi:hypothetical protein